MEISCNHVAGQSTERLAAINDGIFGVAMTLLLLGLHTPAAAAVRSEWTPFHAIQDQTPVFLVQLNYVAAPRAWWARRDAAIAAG